MKINKITSALVIALSVVGSRVEAQWTDHFSYDGCSMVAVAANKIVSGNDMGLFAYDTQEYTFQKISKVNYLSSTGISALGDNGGRLIFVGYEDGNIDVVDLERYSTVNIPELKLSSSVSQKQLLSFCSSGNTLYCGSTGGLYEINLSKSEIKSHYKLRSTEVSVNAIAVLDGQVYVATNVGLLRGDASSQILESSEEWTQISDSDDAYSDVVVFNEKIYAAKGVVGSTNTLYVCQADTLAEVMSVGRFRNLDARSGNLLIASTYQIDIYDVQLELERSVDAYTFGDESVSTPNIRRAKFLNASTIAVGDYTLGAALVNDVGATKTYLPNGPTNNYTYNVLAMKKSVYVTAGGVSSDFNNKGRTLMLHSLVDGQWTTYSVAGKKDALQLTYDKNRQDSIYFSSWGYGVFKVDGDSISHVWNASNSALEDIFGGSNYTRVGAVAFDNYSNLIVTNSQVVNGIQLKTVDNEWYPLSYDPTNSLHSTRNQKVMSNAIFCRIFPRYDHAGRFFFTSNGPYDDSDDMYRCVGYTGDDARYVGGMDLIDEDGEVLTTTVYDVAEDKNGQIWICTSEGVLTYDDDATLFSSNATPVFSHIKVPRNDGTNSADYLLDGVSVTAIAVDGANRKWLGTSTEGVYLVSEDGLTTLKSFNVDNSPLPSNEILSISTSLSTDEVYIATASGLVSYTSDATEPLEEEEVFSDISIYPNPVRPSFTGDVKMKGFKANTQVKITDIKGRLVYQTTSNGGMSTWWNCKGLDGKRVATGTYLVWAITADGLEKSVAKIVVIK